ncbi:hypothetical protein J6Z39_09465 [bacterium]|nr:hypothetical protein [bacterium]
MRVIFFAMKAENPFPVKVSTGESVRISENLTICCTGMGSAGAVVFRRLLEENPDFTELYEFGSAAAVENAETGEIYECCSFFDGDGRLTAESLKKTRFKTASVTGNDDLFLGVKPPWTLGFKAPLLYTMESLRFKKAAGELGREFTSVRLVTDSGEGDIRAAVRRSLELNRARVLTFFNSLK